MHKEKQYPPRLEMTVQLKALDEAERVILSARFDGCVDDYTSPTFQLILPISVLIITSRHAIIMITLFYAIGLKSETIGALEALSLPEKCMRFLKIKCNCNPQSFIIYPAGLPSQLAQTHNNGWKCTSINIPHKSKSILIHYFCH